MSSTLSSPRLLVKQVRGITTMDGAGVKLTRVIGQPEFPMLDPFLLLDTFRSDQPDDYIAGFPPHPHRGFETVTYLLAGRMRHRDSTGREGVIEAGGVQWMTAGNGIEHSEMPEQENGLLDGFQLWVNLPADHKMDTPAYQEFSAELIPVEQREKGISLRVIAGTTSEGTSGPVIQPLTDPFYCDVTMAANHHFSEPLAPGHSAFLYVIQGRLLLQAINGTEQALVRDELGVLGDGDGVALQSGNEPTRFLLIAGRPLGEPVARAGPFVMNTRAELEQAARDYRDGKFGGIKQ